MLSSTDIGKPKRPAAQEWSIRERVRWLGKRLTRRPAPGYHLPAHAEFTKGILHAHLRPIYATLLPLLKLPAFYQELRRTLKSAEKRCETEIHRADANLEQLSDANT